MGLHVFPKLHRIALPLLCLAWMAFAPAAMAQEDEEDIWTLGPANVQLGDIAEMPLPEGYRFIGAEDTRMLMQAMGNPPSDQEMGLIAPNSEDNWFIVFEYDPVGFIEDDDHAEIDADALLKSISDATEAANEQRQEMGGGELHVTGWSEPPHYDTATNNLKWALEAVDEVGDSVVNYNVRLLGRGGYMSATLVSDPAMLSVYKPEAERLLQQFSYVDGKRYGDFVDGDKLAGYGLTALIAGGAGAAAAKLGLFAVLGKFLGKAWKFLVLAFIALGGMIKRFFGALFGRKEETLPPIPPQST